MIVLNGGGRAMEKKQVRESGAHLVWNLRLKFIQKSQTPALRWKIFLFSQFKKRKWNAAKVYNLPNSQMKRDTLSFIIFIYVYKKNNKKNLWIVTILIDNI